MSSHQLLRDSLSQTLAGTLVDAPPNRINPGEDEQREQLQQQAVRRQVTADLIRELYQENQRRVAAELLQSQLAQACLCVCCMCTGAFAFIIFTIYIYAQGYVIYYNYGGKPCDKPLGTWLLVLLLLFPVHLALVLIYRPLRRQQSPDDESFLGCARTIRWILKVEQLIGNPVLLLLGLFWTVGSQTCQETNPSLYSFVRLFLLYRTILWIGNIFVIFCVTSLVLWMSRNSFFEGGPGQHRAAKPGVINKIETVPYSPDLFSDDPSENKQPAECCVCQVQFDAEAPIKRTPCGHFFHEECLGHWLSSYAKSCPLCRLNLEHAVEKDEGLP